MQPQWFETWFDSPYYPLLYAHRSYEEADGFIRNLQAVLHLPIGSRILDLACGDGRHARALAAAGYDVTGADLSQASIARAKEFESNNLHFAVHDMRRPVAANYFHAVLNLFTSFGYFESVRDNKRTIDAVHAALRAEGLFVIDYFNSEAVLRHIQKNPAGTLDVSGKHFSWQKSVVDRKVIKKIKVNDDGKEFHFTESVSLFTLNDFSAMLNGKFEIIQTFGEYDLSPFDEAVSSRLILVCRKK